jgi:cell division initiation protein
MDITPQVINEVVFHEVKKKGGYEPAEVDDFLDAVAAAFADLQRRLRDLEIREVANERRATEAEGRLRELAERPPPPAPEPPGRDLEQEVASIQRTLLLAQQTADQAVREARDEANRLKVVAEAEAEKLLEDARAESRRLHEEAELGAREHGESTRQRLVEEIIALEAIRDGYKSDRTLLERHIEEQRGQIASVVSELQRVLGAGLRSLPAPVLTDVTPPAGVGPDQAADAEPGSTIDLTKAVSPGSAAGDPVTAPSAVALSPDSGTGARSEWSPVQAGTASEAPSSPTADPGPVPDDVEQPADAPDPGGSSAPAPPPPANWPPPPSQPAASGAPVVTSDTRPPPPVWPPGDSQAVAAGPASSGEPSLQGSGSVAKPDRAREEDAWSRFVADEEQRRPAQTEDAGDPAPGSEPVIDLSAPAQTLEGETEPPHRSRFGRRR